VLVEGAAHEDQFLDLLILCYSCGVLGATAVRKPGRPLTAQGCLIPPGGHVLSSAVQIHGPAMMVVGKQASDGYEREVGLGEEFWAGQEPELNSELLRDAAGYLRELLGDSYKRLLAADRRGLASPTPPDWWHRIVELIACGESAADRLDGRGTEGGTVELNGDLLAELVTAAHQMRRWRRHPAWPELVRSLAGETDGQHTVMTLTVASFLADTGNGVGIVSGSGGGRIPDIWSEPQLGERLNIEVKTPQALRGPRRSALGAKGALKVVERQLAKAASTKGGQLDIGQTGIVALGAFHLGSGSTSVLETACRAVLGRQRGRKKHLAAVALMHLSCEPIQEVEEATGKVRHGFSPRLEMRLIAHPSYGGALEIREGRRSPLEI
jgi:hypothetical protein